MYDFELTFLAGKYLHVADFVSRNFDKDNSTPEIKDLNMVIHSLNISTNMKKSLIEETKKDASLNDLKNFINNGWPIKKKIPDALQFYWKLRNDIYLQDEIIFYNERIIVPTSMRSEILSKLHQHLGIEKTKARGRSLVFWPRITQAIENKISGCEICQKYRNANIKQPLILHEVPAIPFFKICMDIFEFGSKNYLVVTDYFSKYINVLKLKNKTAIEVIENLKQVFSKHGIPNQIIVDNQPFGSNIFRQFANQYDMEVITTSPN